VIKGVVIFLMATAILAPGVYAVLDPSLAYCKGMGYEFTIISTEEGDVGMCTIPDGRFVDAWEFLKGRVGKEYSYCEREGYEIKTINDSEKCSSIVSYAYAWPSSFGAIYERYPYKLPFITHLS